MKMQINLEQKDEQEPQVKTKVVVRESVRLMEQEQQLIIEQMQKFHDPTVIQPVLYSQSKTLLQHYLEIPGKERNRRVMKNIKSQLSYLKCFQIHNSNTIPKQLLSIMRRDLDILMVVISKFVHAKLYPKGSIIETVGKKRDKIRILLRGMVQIFQPINHKSYKNCLKNIKLNKLATFWIDKLVEKFFLQKAFGFLFDKMLQDQKKMSQPEENLENGSTVNPENIDQQVFQALQEGGPLNSELANKIMRRCQILTNMSPHRCDKKIREEGELICSSSEQYIIGQKRIFQHSSLCLDECYVMEVQYQIYRKLIELLNNDEEKRYIQILLHKFPMLDYFDAKEYIKRQYMVDKHKEEELLSHQEIKKPNPYFMILRQNQGRKSEASSDEEDDKKSSKKKAMIEQIQEVDTYELPYDSDIYLIISGEVTVRIDKIEEVKISHLEYAQSQRHRKPKELLKLYKNDLFGFEQIGKTKEYNLTYIIKKSSKLLLIHEEVYIKHFYEIPGFKTVFKEFQTQRNKVINKILINLNKLIDDQMMNRYKSLSVLEEIGKTKQSKKIQIRDIGSHRSNFIKQIQYIGQKQFMKVQQKILKNINKAKQGEKNNILVGEIVRNSEELKVSVSLASIFSKKVPKGCEVVGQWVEVRDSNGILKRRRHIGANGDGTGVLRKIGVVTQDQRTRHNFALVKNRKSKYELPDFTQEKKQFLRLKEIEHSLPKLTHFYAKKQQILYRNIHKRDL